MAKDETFLSRWSRRKLEQVATPASDETPPVEFEAPPAPAEIGKEEAAGEGEISREELDRLPRIEDIGIETDIRQFLRRGVPRALRNAALRRKWLATPSIRDHKDCAVDYAWDWNTPGGVPGDGMISRESVSRLVRAIGQDVESAADGSEASRRPVRDVAESVTVEEKAEPQSRDAGLPTMSMEESARERSVDATSGSETEPADALVPRRHGSAWPV